MAKRASNGRDAKDYQTNEHLDQTTMVLARSNPIERERTHVHVHTGINAQVTSGVFTSRYLKYKVSNEATQALPTVSRFFPFGGIENLRNAGHEYQRYTYFLTYGHLKLRDGDQWQY